MNVIALDVASVGLLLIIIGWSIQIYHTWRYGNVMHPLFLLFNAMGSLVLATEGMKGGLENISSPVILNLVTFLLAILVLASVAPLDEREPGMVKLKKKK
ncbi:Uncharacterised protein [uncultured archaeon]|nr:Uncharacterised protein [uncultured archaeon]